MFPHPLPTNTKPPSISEQLTLVRVTHISSQSSPILTPPKRLVMQVSFFYQIRRFLIYVNRHVIVHLHHILLFILTAPPPLIFSSQRCSHQNILLSYRNTRSSREQSCSDIHRCQFLEEQFGSVRNVNL